MATAPKISIIATQQDWVNDHLQTLDQSSFNALYIADHPSFATTDSWSWLAYAAGQTTRIKLGTHVTGASFHHPTRLAKQVTTVDNLSNGRAVLGIGTGYEVKDYAPYGYDMPDFKGRVAYMDEMLTVMRQLFSGSIDGFDGQYLKFKGKAEFAPLPVQKPYPTIMVGLNMAGLAMQVAARQADAINTWQLGPSAIDAIRGPLADATIAAGRKPEDVAITCDVLMVPNADFAAAEALAHQIRDMARGWGRKESVTQWEADGVLHGDGDAMCEQIMRFADVGVSEITVSVSDIDQALWLNAEVARKL
ncbi:MAG: LLM class flavin-dependent oxidoreductase [Alphaproteobacteria bacterium]|nr:MAG: LLM class flavin-dependent oxidoreductase [Alphaproteobacteria bacterium]